MHCLRKFAALFPLAIACLLGAAPTVAQGPIGAGAGAFVAGNQQVHVFAFHLAERADHSIHGNLIVLEPATQSLVQVELTSYMYIGATLTAAGTITMAINAPPMFPVGGTAFFAVNDNPGAPDQFAGLGNVPPQYGSPTIQQIIALIGPPPPQALRPLLTGNVLVF